MKVKTKVILAAAGSVACILSYSAWTFSQSASRQIQSETQASLTHQSLVLRQYLQNFFTSTKKDLISVAESELNLQSSSGKSGEQVVVSKKMMASPFLSLAFVSSLPDGGYQIESTSLSASVAGTWTSDILKAGLQQIPMERARGSSVAFARFEGPRGQSYLSLAVEAQIKNENIQNSANSNQLIWGVVPLSYMADVNSSYKSFGTDLLLVDSRGFALVYPEQQYVGAFVEQHPIVSQAIKSQKSFESGEFKNLNQQHGLGLFDKIPGTNLILVLFKSTPNQMAWLLTDLLQLALAGVAFFVLLFSILHIIYRPLVGAINYALESLTLMDQRTPIRPVSDGNVASLLLRELLLKIETRFDSSEDINSSPSKSRNSEVVREIGVGLSQAVRGPIAAILGHAQLARSKSESENLKQHFIVIEREARQLRDVSENLLKSTGAKDFEFERVDLQEVVMAAIHKKRGDISNRGIKLNKKLGFSAQIMANFSMLQGVVEELLQNAIEAVSDTHERSISVELYEKDGRACLDVSDNGKGLTSTEQQHIFDPFYSTKLEKEGSGLGLTVALGVVNKCEGEITVHSNPGEGARFTLQFPFATSLNHASTQYKKQTTAAEENSKAEALYEPQVESKFESKVDPNVNARRESVEVAKVDEADRLTAQAVKPVNNESPTPYPSQSVRALAGRAALTGTKAEVLPAPPAPNEVTFVGDMPEVENSVAEKLTQAEAVKQETAEIELVMEPGFAPVASQDLSNKPVARVAPLKTNSNASDGRRSLEDVNVKVRKPKVRMEH